MFYEPTKFEFVNILESNWIWIKQELLQLQPDNFRPWLEKSAYGKGWDIFPLYLFERKINKNCLLCPETDKILESIPGVASACFSCLAPKTSVHPHVGQSNSILRCHLGLIVPNGCDIRVGNETRSWQEGKCLVFEDTVEHEAWNQGDIPRFILLVDFKKDNFYEI